MSTTTQYPHVTIDVDGVARFTNSRYSVGGLAAEHYHYGWSADEMLRQHPDLRPEEVDAALTCFYDHADEIVTSIQRSADEVEQQRSSQRLTRSELLRRRDADN